MTTPKLEIEELTANQDQPEVLVNAGFRKLEAVIQLVALDRVAALPGSPSDGACYILTADDGGGENGQVAFYSSGWIFIDPKDGWLAWVADEAAFYQFGSGSPANWALWVPGGAGMSYVTVDNQGSPAATVLATSLLFSGAEVTDAGAGVALVTIAPSAPSAAIPPPVVDTAASNLAASSSNSGNYTRFAHATGTYTFDPSAGFAIGAEYHGTNVGAGTLTITAAGDMTIHAPALGTLVIPPRGRFTVKIVEGAIADLIGQTVPA